jgi:hypothetical protein
VSELVDGPLASDLDRLLTRAVNRGRGVRHGLLAVGDVDGSWIWRGAHGVADPDGTPVTVDTRYPIASVTKLYTGLGGASVGGCNLVAVMRGPGTFPQVIALDWGARGRIRTYGLLLRSYLGSSAVLTCGNPLPCGLSHERNRPSYTATDPLAWARP